MRRATLALTFVIVGIALCVHAQTIVSTHAVYGEFARVIGGDAVNVVTIIPSGFCPSHYDLAPSDVAAVLDAKLILYSGFEVWIDTLADAAGGDAEAIQLSGSWSTPDAAIQKVEAIRDLLIENMPESAALFRANADAYIEELRALGEDLREQAIAAGVCEIPVVCMAWQVDLVSWLGFQIPVTYGIPAGLSLRDLIDLAAAGREAKAELVIDNLQSGVDFGAKLAREIGAIHVVLSNFPGAMPNTVTVIDLLRRNAEALFSAVEPLDATQSP